MIDHKRDDGTPVGVDYVIEQHGSFGNMWDDPGEPTIVNITDAWIIGGDSVELTDAERERIEQEIGAQIDADPSEPDFDF